MGMLEGVLDNVLSKIVNDDKRELRRKEKERRDLIKSAMEASNPPPSPEEEQHVTESVREEPVHAAVADVTPLNAQEVAQEAVAEAQVAAQPQSPEEPSPMAELKTGEPQAIVETVVEEAKIDAVQAVEPAKVDEPAVPAVEAQVEKKKPQKQQHKVGGSSDPLFIFQ